MSAARRYIATTDRSRSFSKTQQGAASVLDAAPFLSGTRCDGLKIGELQRIDGRERAMGGRRTGWDPRDDSNFVRMASGCRTAVARNVAVGRR
jgi:hypothetical protein